MYQKLSEREIELIKEIENRTGTDYELLGEFLPIDSFICMVEDLMGEIGILEEKIENCKEYREQYCNLMDKCNDDLLKLM